MKQVKQEDLARQTWDEEAIQWSERNKKMWDKGSRSEILPFFKKYLKAEDKILDIGCASGYSTYRLNEMNFEAEGADISNEMIKLAKENYPNLHFNIENISSLSFEDGSYDGLLCINVLEFTETPSQAVNEIYRVLKKGGRACVGILGPTAGPRQNSFQRLYDKAVIMNTMQAWEFEEIAKARGFKMIDGIPVSKQWPIDLNRFPVQAQQALSFMYVFIIEK